MTRDSTNGSIFVGGRYWTLAMLPVVPMITQQKKPIRLAGSTTVPDFPEGIKGTQPVGSKATNDLGLYDMSTWQCRRMEQ